MNFPLYFKAGLSITNFSKIFIKLLAKYIMTSAWCNNIMFSPKLSWKDATKYLIETPSKFTKEMLNAYKSLEAYEYFVCNEVHYRYYHEISKDSFVLSNQRWVKVHLNSCYFSEFASELGIVSRISSLINC